MYIFIMGCCSWSISYYIMFFLQIKIQIPICTICLCPQEEVQKNEKNEKKYCDLVRLKADLLIVINQTTNKEEETTQ